MEQGLIYEPEGYDGKGKMLPTIRLRSVNANSQKNNTVETILKKHEKGKKRAYNQGGS